MIGFDISVEKLTGFDNQATTAQVSACEIISPSTDVNPYDPFFLPRNSRGSLPVYTDVRNTGMRYLILIRNIEGDL
jgi:Mitochondrial large subunit ribosomal protein (Img2)